MNPTDDSAPLLFDWDKARKFRFVLPTFLLLSILAHAATFFLFQITESEHATIPPSAPEISLLLPTTPENRLLLRRIEAENPGLVAEPTSVTPPGLVEPQYQPSYDTIRTQPRTVPEARTAVQYPPPKDPLAIIQSTSTTPLAASAAPPPQPTRITFSAPLNARTTREPLGWTLSPRASAPLGNATFLIGVTDRGEARYLFLQRSSGDPALDRQAADELPRLAFSHAAEAVTWGVATIVWGEDAYTAEATSPSKAK